MRILAWTVLIVSLGCTLCCNLFSPVDKTYENTDVELIGVHYAKLNSIGCYARQDLIAIKSASFETIENFIREKKCFVIPTDKDIILNGRAMDGIVDARIKGANEAFYTYRSNLSFK